MIKRLLALLLLAMPAAAQAPDAAYRAAFSAETLGRPLPGPSVTNGFTMLYRGTWPHAAFAVAQDADGRGAWGIASGHSSPAAARAEAMRLCTDSARNARTGPLRAECRIVALDGAVEGHAPIPLRMTTIGPFRASPLHYHSGPERAAGVVVWAHGYGGPDRDLRGLPVPGFISALNNAGWDVLRFDRHPGDDALHHALPRLMQGLPLLRDYRQVVLAGQSRGGWQALLAATLRPDLVDGIMATAPAAHGEVEEDRGALAMEDFRRHIAALPRDRPRVMMTFFEGDEFDPSPAARAAALAGLQRSAPTLALHPRGPARGHNGGTDWRFTRDFAACLLTFFNGPSIAAPRGVRREGCGGG
ncbi:MAG: alpha/beta hydrolase [Alphaproteobacteria bacterium]|nr:alpha/beta hydrolase [Alphaproteobacteria bacterium]